MILGDRFWSKVQKTDTCWLWVGTGNRTYGQYWLAGRMRPAHRVAYEAAYGPIPPGLDIDHACHVGRCVNPAHLHAVTKRQNQENRAGAQVNSASGVRGVARHRNEWQVAVRVGGKQHYGGCFVDLADAAKAARELRRALMTNSLADQKEWT